MNKSKQKEGKASNPETKQSLLNSWRCKKASIFEYISDIKRKFVTVTTPAIKARKIIRFDDSFPQNIKKIREEIPQKANEDRVMLPDEYCLLVASINFSIK